MQIWLLMICVAAVGSNSLVLSPILSDVSTAFSATPAEVARAAAAYGGATAVSALWLGRLSDRLGGRRALTIGLMLLGLAMVFCALSWHWVVLALAQVLAGIGAGILLPGAYAIAVKIAKPGEDARALGRVLTGWSVSLVAGVPVSAFMTDLLGWRSVFIMLAVLVGLVILGCRALPKAEAVAAGHKSLSPIAVLRIPAVAPLLLICLAFMSSFYGTYSFLGDHLRVTLNASASEAGLLVLFYGAGFGLAGLGDGLIDRFGARRLFPIALALVSAVYLSMIPAVAGLVTILIVGFIWGFVNHFTVNILILLLSRTEPDQRSAILGVNSAVTYLGAMVGAAAYGEMYTLAGFTPLAVAGSLATVGAAVVAAIVSSRYRNVKAAAQA